MCKIAKQISTKFNISYTDIHRQPVLFNSFENIFEINNLINKY